MRNLWASGVKLKPVIGEVFTDKLYSVDTGITGQHLEKCSKGCPGSFAQCAASLIEDSEVWGSHVGGSEDLCLLGCDTLSLQCLITKVKALRSVRMPVVQPDMSEGWSLHLIHIRALGIFLFLVRLVICVLE